MPEKKILYQFSARGHELGQILLGMLMTKPHDAVSGYYRSRPLGLSVTDALKSGLGKGGGISDGRDIGVVFNMPGGNVSNGGGATVLPMAGGVGTQYTTTAGWAHAIRYVEIFDTTMGWRFINPALKAKYGIDSMPETAENIASEFSISRSDQDAFACRSQQCWVAANERGYFEKELVAACGAKER